MEGEVNKIVLKKIYLGSALFFGLLYGVLLGLVMAVFSMLGFFDISFLLGLGSGGSFVSALISFFVFLVLVVLICVVGAIIYNLIGMIGGALNLGLVEPSEDSGKDNAGMKDEKKTGKNFSDNPTKPTIISGGSTMRLNSMDTKQNNNTKNLNVKASQGNQTRVKSNPNTAVIGKRK